MREGKFTLFLFLWTLAHALIIEDPQKGQSLPAGFKEPTLKSSLDDPSLGSAPFGFGQISPFSGPSQGVNTFSSFPSGTGPVNSAPSFSRNSGSFPTFNGLPGFGAGGFPTGSGSISNQPGFVGPVNSIPGFSANSGSFPTGNGPTGSLPGFSSSGRGFPFPFDPSSSGSLISSRTNPSFGALPISPFSPGLSGRLRPNTPVHGSSPGILVPVNPSDSHDVPVKHDSHHHDVPVKPDPHHHDVPVKHDSHHHDIPVKLDPHHHDVHVPVKLDPHHHDVHVPVKHDPHHHDVPVKKDTHHHLVVTKHHDPHHHDASVHINPHAGDVAVDDFNIYSHTHKIGDLVPIGSHGVPRPPPPPHNGPECQFSGCSIGQECVIAKTILTKSETLCPRAYSGRCVCVPGCIHNQKFIPHGYLKYEGRCSYCKCYADGRVECKKSKACFAAKKGRGIHRDVHRDVHRDIHHRDVPVDVHRDVHHRDVPVDVHRDVHRGVSVFGRRKTFNLAGMINRFLRNLF